MSQDKSISRRNKVDWHMANDDPILKNIRFIPQHEVVQRYGAILPDYLTNLVMKASEAYKTYHDLDTGKVAKSRKKKQPALGFENLLEVALTEAEQLKLVTKRSLIQTHSSHASGSGAHEGTGVIPRVPDVPTYHSDDEEIPWNEKTNSDNDGDEFVHPKFTTHDDEARQEAEVNEEDNFYPRVQTPSRAESTSDEDNQGADVEEQKMDEDATNVEEEGNELYKDVNINLAE
ncbi:hypothetical protein Tco_0319216 [Tanacetum coccineum]